MLAKLRALFDRYDADGDGRLDRSELSTALAELDGDDITYADLLNTLGAFDANGDGRVSFDEFVSLMNAAEDVDLEE